MTSDRPSPDGDGCRSGSLLRFFHLLADVLLDRFALTSLRGVLITLPSASHPSPLAGIDPDGLHHLQQLRFDLGGCPRLERRIDHERHTFDVQDPQLLELTAAVQPPVTPTSRSVRWNSPKSHSETFDPLGT